MKYFAVLSSHGFISIHLQMFNYLLDGAADLDIPDISPSLSFAEKLKLHVRLGGTS